MKQHGVVGLLLMFSISLHGMDWLGALENLYYFPCVEKFNDLIRKGTIPPTDGSAIFEERDAWGVFVIGLCDKSSE